MQLVRWQTAMCCFTLSTDNRKHVTQEINIIFLVPGKNSNSFLLCLESVPMAMSAVGRVPNKPLSSSQFSCHSSQKDCPQDCRSFT